MKYGLPELPEEKDIPELYRKMLKAGIAWGCSYLNGFLESMNEKREPNNRFTVLVKNPGECDFCDFVFAIKNRICAVVFDIYSWEHHLLTYERRTRLIEASLEHRLMPIVVNFTGGWHMETYKEPEPGGFETAGRWMTDAVSGVSVLPEQGLGSGDEKVFYPLDEWAAELYAKRAARLALEEDGFSIARIYPNNRFIWATNRDGQPTWVLLSFHHSAIKDAPDYSDFDKSDPCVAGKAGYGVDVAIHNNDDESLVQPEHIKPVYRSSNIASEVVAISKLADGIKKEGESYASIRAPVGEADKSSPSSDTGTQIDDDDDPFDENGLPKKKTTMPNTVFAKIDGDEQQRERWCQEHKIDYPVKKRVYTKEMLASMSPKEKLTAAITIAKKKLSANPGDEKLKAKLKEWESLLFAKTGGEPK